MLMSWRNRTTSPRSALDTSPTAPSVANASATGASALFVTSEVLAQQHDGDQGAGEDQHLEDRRERIDGIRAVERRDRLPRQHRGRDRERAQEPDRRRTCSGFSIPDG
jgi:hypothetical protein